MRIAEDSARAKGAFIRFNSFFRSIFRRRCFLEELGLIEEAFSVS